MIKIFSSILLSTLFLFSCSHKTYYPNISTYTSPKGTAIYQPDSASIAQSYAIPEWFRDGKLGIFIHWGLNSVPANDGWYARHMYQEGGHVKKFHEEKYGLVTEFGYKDFIPMFNPNKFNPNEWMKLFKEIGATYVVPVAEHHDGFALYDSAFNPWNSVDMGPKRDFMKELKVAAQKEGLHFGLSSHRAEHCWFYNHGMKSDSDVQDTNITLYGERIEEPDGGWGPQYDKHEGSNEHSRENWLKHIYELVDLYEPELLWFDWTVGKEPFQPTFYQFMAYYYNNAVDWKKEVVVNTKFGFGDNIQVFDIERGKSDEIRPFAWQTDTSLGKEFWFHMENEEDLKTANHLIDDFVDIVSKNGNLLLNVGPRADGSIPQKQIDLLYEIRDWLKINGEAIYGSRPWIKSGEGQQGTSGYMTDSQSTDYTAHDIRFTTNNDFLYVIALGWTNQSIIVKSLNLGTAYTVKDVSMLGSDETIKWKQQNDGLHLIFPNEKVSDHAHTFKIVFH